MSSDAPEPNPWSDIIGPCYTDQSLSWELGVSRAWVSRAVRDLRVLQLTTADQIHVYPAFQVRDGQILPGLELVLRELANGSSSRLMWAQWLNRPRKRSDGETRRRIDELAAGHIDSLVEEARHTAAAWDAEEVVRPAWTHKIDTVTTLIVRDPGPEERGRAAVNDQQPRPAADDAELFRQLVEWEGDDLPSALDPLLARFRDSARPDFYVSQGWWPLIVKLDQRLAMLDPSYRLSQVKSKFAILQFYLASMPRHDVGSAFANAIREAEAEAARTCELCGKPGVLRRSREGTYALLCADDAGTKYRPTGDDGRRRR